MDGSSLRLAYITTWSLGNETGPGDGVRKKIGGQIRALAANGVDAQLFLLATRPCEVAWGKELPADRLRIFVHGARLDRERVAAELGAAVRRFAPDVLYSRQEPVYPGLLPVLRRFPLVIELNGDEEQENRDTPTYYRVYRRLSREIMARVARGSVAVSNDLLTLEPYASQGLRTVVIGNGIDLGTIDPLPPPPPHEKPRFVFIGGILGAAWHGIPKIIELARARPDWHIDLVGMTQAELGVAKLPNLHAHGVLARDAYSAILAAADIGIGSLSAHVKGAREGSALKTREYLAHGLATIIGYRDTDFLSGAPFLLELPNTPSNVATSIDRIERFAEDWKGRRLERSAIVHLDNATKEQRRLDFLRGFSRR